MTANTTTQPRSATPEQYIAYATSAAPLAAGILAPFLNTDAALAAQLTTLASTGLATANVMDLIPHRLYADLPAGDILRAHRLPMFISHLTTAIAVGMGTFTGPAGTDALMLGFLEPATTKGIVSLGWYTAVALIPWQLRNVLRRRRRKRTPTTALPGKPAHAPTVGRELRDILAPWGRYISHPENGTHKNQVLRVTGLNPRRWAGVITAPTGQPVTVTAEAVSGVYRVPTDWIHITEGAHASERRITLNWQAPPELDTNTLQGAWKKWIAKSGGIMAGTYLEAPQPDPHTGGEVAYVVAGDDLDKLPLPDRASLAGALRTNTLLCSYNPVPGNPRRGEVRLMKHNPLEDGVPFPGTHVLKISDGGYVQVGRHVSGFPARIQFTDPVLGAKHLFIAGVTGSGKGGLVQIVALADHVNGHAILYADPKGSSNPDVETMACYSGLVDGVMGTLRIAYALMNWRMEESSRLKMKNFQPTPTRPWVRVILDEAHVPLSEWDQHKKEAGTIVEALAAKARSQGIILTIVNQAVNADKVGGSTALRMNVIQGGSLVMLRSDSGQQHLVTTGFEGVDPGDIPASWDVERPLVYDENVALKDPKATFGLGYTLGPGGAAEMMRTFILESAAPHIDPAAIAHPADWPDWDNRHDIAATPILGDGETDQDGDAGMLFGGFELTKKPETAQDKILKALHDMSDPLGQETTYVHRDDIGRMAGVEGTTLAHNLGKLTKAGKIHRQPKDSTGKDVRGFYGLGPGADDTNDSEDDDA
jgi:hypothetical protein